MSLDAHAAARPSGPAASISGMSEKRLTQHPRAVEHFVCNQGGGGRASFAVVPQPIREVREVDVVRRAPEAPSPDRSVRRYRRPAARRPRPSARSGRAPAVGWRARRDKPRRPGSSRAPARPPEGAEASFRRRAERARAPRSPAPARSFSARLRTRRGTPPRPRGGMRATGRRREAPRVRPASVTTMATVPHPGVPAPGRRDAEAPIASPEASRAARATSSIERPAGDREPRAEIRKRRAVRGDQRGAEQGEAENPGGRPAASGRSTQLRQADRKKEKPRRHQPDARLAERHRDRGPQPPPRRETRASTRRRSRRGAAERDESEREGQDENESRRASPEPGRSMPGHRRDPAGDERTPAPGPSSRLGETPSGSDGLPRRGLGAEAERAGKGRPLHGERSAGAHDSGERRFSRETPVQELHPGRRPARLEGSDGRIGGSRAGASPHQARAFPRGSARAIQVPAGASPTAWRALEKSLSRSTAMPPPDSDRETSGFSAKARVRAARSRETSSSARRSSGGAAPADGGRAGIANHPSSQASAGAARTSAAASTRCFNVSPASV